MVQKKHRALKKRKNINKDLTSIFTKTKCFVIDLDGTLLNSKKLISRENKLACEFLQKQGYKIVIATGRTLQSAKKYANQIGLKKHNGFIISLAGAIIYDCGNNKIIWSQEIESEIVRKIIIAAISDKWSIISYTKDRIYSTNGSLLNRYIVKKIQAKVGEEIHRLSNEYDFFKLNNILKIVIFQRAINASQLTKRFLQKHSEHINHSQIYRTAIEITAKSVSKYSSFQFLYKNFLFAEPKKKIINNQICYLGDSMNDISFFTTDCWKVAPENAKPKIKKLATVIGPDYDDNLLYFIMQKFQLLKKQNLI